MKVYNQTNIDNQILFNIMRDAGVTAAGPIKRVVIRYNDRLRNKAGHCIKKGSMIIIELRFKYDLVTLAHEVRHLAQYTVGLGPVMAYEREYVPYAERAHEVDATEFSRRYA